MQTSVGYHVSVATIRTAVVDQANLRQTLTAATMLPATINMKSASQSEKGSRQPTGRLKPLHAGKMTEKQYPPCLNAKRRQQEVGGDEIPWFHGPDSDRKSGNVQRLSGRMLKKGSTLPSVR